MSVSSVSDLDTICNNQVTRLSMVFTCGTAYSTFDSGGTYNQGAVSLTQGDLLQSAIYPGAYGSGAYSNIGHSTGKYYSESTVTMNAGSSAVSMGIANASMAAYASLGGDTNSLAYIPSGVVKINGSTLSTIASYASGNTIDMAFDATNSLIWFRVNNGNWNNSGLANPATGVGGISTATLAAGPYFEASAIETNTPAVDSWLLNFGRLGFTRTPPSGFGKW
jgi:hypothetical protein